MYDLIIIGSGPAGLTAAIYASRAKLRTLVVGGTVWGGQLMFTGVVENFPGFKDGILGPDLMSNMLEQAKKFGAEIIFEDATWVDFSARPFKVGVDQKTYKGRAVIIATGASPKWLGLKGEERLRGRGVSVCAVCDAALLEGKVAVVVGGGDSAMEDALTLSKYAREVIVVHRRDRLRASKLLQERAFKESKIKFLWNSVVQEILGEEKVEGLRLRKVDSGEEFELRCDAVFIAIGRQPSTEIFRGQVELDEKGYVITKDGAMTNIKGVFVAGEASDAKYRQAIVAAGEGCKAALDAIWYLENHA
jgi:thioredoxin reductase (NADPH)